MKKTSRILLPAAFLLLTSATVLAIAGLFSRTDDTISLAGEWKFALDPQDKGVSEKWYAGELKEQIQMPGSCEQRGYGEEATEPTVGRLTRVVRYEGKAWYQKEITVPKAWKDKHVELFLERCHWESNVWVDNQFVGTQNSLSAPHLYDLGQLSPGKHRLTVCIDNTYKIPIGSWAHAITEDTQGNWNGMIGQLELRATPTVWIKNVQVHPDRMLVDVGNATGNSQNVTIQGEKHTIPSGGCEVAIAFKIDGPTWDEFEPNLQTIKVELKSTSGNDSRTVSYANRTMTIGGKQIIVNGHAVLFRGPVDECVYPLTGYPPMDRESWMRIMRICKSYGFNYMRFHSWCPPEAAFEAADDMGFYFQIELPFWSMDVPHYGEHAERDKFLSQELRTILDTYGNHPSFALMAMGNESSGPLEILVREGKARDSRHLYRAENGQSTADGDVFETGMRGIAGPRTDWDRWSANGWIAGVSGDGVSRNTGSELPTLGHEIGQWEMYPDFDEIEKYTGTLRALNYEGYRHSLEAHGMLAQNKDFARASGKFSVLLYKEDIEASMRTWPFGGFQILEARDYPGQGTAVVGWLDAFWDTKGLITPEEFSQFCGPRVLLMQMSRRIFTDGETFEGYAEMANYCKDDITLAPQWTLTDDQGKTIGQGKLPAVKAEAGKVTNIGKVEIPLKCEKAAKMTVTLKNGKLKNKWEIWVYPKNDNADQNADDKNGNGVRIAYKYDDETRKALQRGESVLLFSNPTTGLFPLKPAFFGDDDVRLFDVTREVHALEGSFMPAFWNMRLFNQTGTLGILCQPDHPALKGFPTEEHSNWQWADLLGRFSAAQSFRTAGAPSEYCDEMEQKWGDVRNRSKAIVLNGAPEGYRPIVQAIDNFERNYRLGIIFETRVGKGRLLVCAIDLDTDIDSRPAARCLRKSLIEYASGNDFNPEYELDPKMLDIVLYDNSETNRPQGK